MINLSVTIITLNEEKNLPKCFDSISDVADEVIVVDCGSIDDTVKIAKGFKAKVYYRKFDNYANQKNFAASKAKGDWILSVDADEEISPKLPSEILKVIRKNAHEYVGYSI